MARRESDSPKSGNRHKEIDAKVEDDTTRAARVWEETSSDGKFSTYEVAPKKDPRDGDLILQHRGTPRD
jgi:hypothetical protein